jgi:hypothetical protein
MSAITSIRLRLVTGNREGAGTDGNVYLGLAGREFHVDSSGDVNDFERASDRTYIFGTGANVADAAANDPRSPLQLDHLDIARFPTYIRFEAVGGSADWNLERVEVQVSAEGTSVNLAGLEGSEHLWLGQRRGKMLYFR